MDHGNGTELEWNRNENFHGKKGVMILFMLRQWKVEFFRDWKVGKCDWLSLTFQFQSSKVQIVVSTSCSCFFSSDSCIEMYCFFCWEEIWGCTGNQIARYLLSLSGNQASLLVAVTYAGSWLPWELRRSLTLIPFTLLESSQREVDRSTESDSLSDGGFLIDCFQSKLITRRLKSLDMGNPRYEVDFSIYLIIHFFVPPQSPA